MFIYKIQTVINILKYNRNNVGSLLKLYKGNDWIHYIYRNAHTGYYRGLLEKNDEFALYIMTWYPDSKTEIHSHPKECYYKIMYGNLMEHRHYKDEVQRVSLKADDIGYIDDNIGKHQIFNKNKNDLSISMHIYSFSKDTKDLSYDNTRDMRYLYNALKDKTPN